MIGAWSVSFKVPSSSCGVGSCFNGGNDPINAAVIQRNHTNKEGVERADKPHNDSDANEKEHGNAHEPEDQVDDKLRRLAAEQDCKRWQEDRQDVSHLKLLFRKNCGKSQRLFCSPPVLYPDSISESRKLISNRNQALDA
jgi:hypothetical protein